MRKISDVLWEIPSDFRPEMRVPARFYADERALELIFGDRSLSQLVNLTALPGINRYALAMPDIHEGYGSPIGGVFATKVEEGGIISPGAVGYDINCVHPNSLINLSCGAYLPIKDLSRYLNYLEIPLINKKTRQIKIAKAIHFLFRQENKEIYSIKTKSGFRLKATGDHPIYTLQGMKKAELLNVGDKLITYPFRGAPYRKPQNLKLISKRKIYAALNKLDLLDNGNRWSQIINWLEKRDFINLNLNSWQTPYLIKIIGYLFGDGTLNLIGKDAKGVAAFYGGLDELKQIKNDLEKLGVNSKIWSRERKHEFTNSCNKTYKFTKIEHCLRINSTAFALLLYLLKVPFGNKVYQEFQMPSWLQQAPLWQKRLFLASFFGAEMSKPATINKFNFRSPTLNINKAISLKKNGAIFLGELKKILKEFDIHSGDIAEIKGLGNAGKTIGLRFQIDGSSQNLIKFFEIIGFEYHKEKHKLSCLATAYLRQKLEVVSLRRRIRKLVKNLYFQGTPVKELVNVYGGNFAGKRFIEHSAWSNRGEPRVAFNFMSFDEFVENYSHSEDGFVIDEIEEVRKENYQGLVYDLTINDINHNFIANNLIVSNCGVRLLTSEAVFSDIEGKIDKLADFIQAKVPSGLGRGRQKKMSITELDRFLQSGAQEAVRRGFGAEEDFLHSESEACFGAADPDEVSPMAKNRGRNQLGTLGSGNHFLEIQRVDQIFNKEAAKAFGLFNDQVVIMIHTGSRGLGHQVATDYIRLMIRAMPKYGIKLPDQELACAPFNSAEGQKYFKAMAAAANFAWANRQMITYWIREAWKEAVGRGQLAVLYDVAHNIAKLEKGLLAHRKGATRAFPPNHSEVPEKYRTIGQPVLIPGSMGTASYVLSGTQEAEQSFYSTCHGAGRQMSRHQANRTISGKEVVRGLSERGIIVKSYSMRGVAEEAPQAYKDIEGVVAVVDQAGLSKKTARLRPLAVIKGE